MQVLKRVGIGAVALVSLLIAGGAHNVSPAQADPIPGASQLDSSTPENWRASLKRAGIKGWGTGADWNSTNPKQPATDSGPIVPGVNAGGPGGPMEGIPVPAIDYAGTAKFYKEHPGVGTRGPGENKIPVAHATPPVKTKTQTVAKAALTNPCSGTPDGFCHFYATGQDGGTAVIKHYWTQRVAKPGLGVDGAPDGLTAAEGIIYKTSNDDFVGGGTLVSVVHCGTTTASPCLFVDRGDDGNINTTPWANGVGCNPCIGTSLTSWVGTSKVFGLERINGYWWLAANGQWSAAVATNSWTTPYLTQGDLMQEFFEAVENESLTPDTDMGDGSRPSCTGTLAGSYFINGTWSDVNGVSSSLNFDFVGPMVTGGGSINTLAYNACQMTGNYFRGGGPGY